MLVLLVCLIGTSADSFANDNCALAQVISPRAGPRAVSAVSFGAKPDDSIDDTAALQAALDSLKPGDYLTFTPGRYLFSKSLKVRTPRVSLLGAGVTLHATNADDQSLMIIADKVSLYDFTLTAVTEGRKSAPRHHRVAVLGQVMNGDRRSGPVADTLISGLHIVPGNPAVPSEANGGSAAGIFLSHAIGFRVIDNEVVRTLADGIHVTAGSHHGIISGNQVRETGDDMIALVSYAPSPAPGETSKPPLAANYDAASADGLVHNVLVASNDVSGNYWGRGVSVVGGASITIADNHIHDIPVGTGAAILIAREQTYTTFGVANILVERNQIGPFHKASAAYNPGGKNVGRDNGHGAVELHTFVFDDEASNESLMERLGVSGVLISKNRFADIAGAAIRSGVGGGGSKATASGQSRRFRVGRVANIGVVGNVFNNTTVATSFKSDGSDTSTFFCGKNERDGVAVAIASCAGPEARIVGAALNCSSNGLISLK